MSTVTTIGLDIAKSVFQVHGISTTGEVLMPCTWSGAGRCSSSLPVCRRA